MRNKNNRTDFYQGLFGKNVIPCKFGCGTSVMFDKDLKLWLEKWTGKPHPKKRCDYIKEKEKTKQRNKNDLSLRMDKVMEMKDILAEMPYGTPITDKVKVILEKRDTEEKAVTMSEICAAIMPGRMIKNEEGDDEPKEDAIYSVRGAMTRLRKDPNNKDVTIFSKRFENGIWYYYNIPTSHDFKPVKTRLDNQVFGVNETIGRTESMLQIKEKILTKEEHDEKLRKNKEEYDRKKLLKKQMLENRK